MLIAAVAVAWLIAVGRFILFPPASGAAPSVYATLGAIIAVNAVVLGFCAWWVWAWKKWGVGLALGVVVGNLLLVINAAMSVLDWIVLGLLVAAAGLIISLMIRPEAD